LPAIDVNEVISCAVR